MAWETPPRPFYFSVRSRPNSPNCVAKLRRAEKQAIKIWRLAHQYVVKESCQRMGLAGANEKLLTSKIRWMGRGPRSPRPSGSLPVAWAETSMGMFEL